MLKNSASLIQTAKIDASLSEDAKLLNNNQAKILFTVTEKKYDELVTILMIQWDLANSIKKKERLDDVEQQAQRELYINNAFRSIEDVVTDISRDELELCKFCYELRKLDVEDKYTHEFLYGQVKP